MRQERTASETALWNALRKHTPVQIFFGKGQITALPRILRHKKSTSVVIVISGSVKKLKEQVLRPVLTGISKKNKVVELAPKTSCATTQWLRGSISKIPHDADTFIAIGGGSVMDATKALAVMAATRRSIESLLIDPPEKDFERQNTLILVPTTFATGSETSQGAVIIDDRSGVRKNLKGLFSLPDVAIIDSSLVTMRNSYSRLAAFDVFSHAVEGYLSKKATPQTRYMCLEVISDIGKRIERIKRAELNQGDAVHLMYDASLMGIVLQRASTCLPHRLSYALPRRLQYDISHPEATALFFPAWLNHVNKNAPTELLHLSQALKTPAAAFILQIRTQLGLTRSLAQVGVKPRSKSSIIKRCTGNLTDDPSYVGADSIRDIVMDS